MMNNDTVSCRVQYVDDSDPFATTSCSHLEPSRPVLFDFKLHQPVGEQLPDVIRTLRAPHKAKQAAFQIYKYEGNIGDYGSYLDLEMSLMEQEDDLVILKADPVSTSTVMMPAKQPPNFSLCGQNTRIAHVVEVRPTKLKTFGGLVGPRLKVPGQPSSGQSARQLLEASAYRPQNTDQNTKLPLIVKPLRQYQLSKVKCSDTSTRNPYPEKANPSGYVDEHTLKPKSVLHSAKLIESYAPERLLMVRAERILHVPPRRSTLRLNVQADSMLNSKNSPKSSQISKICQPSTRRLLQTAEFKSTRDGGNQPVIDWTNSTMTSGILKPRVTSIDQPINNAIPTKPSRRLTIPGDSVGTRPGITIRSNDSGTTARFPWTCYGTSSLKRGISHELPRKTWFDSSVDGPIEQQQCRRNSLVVRTQTSLRVKAVIDKLLKTSGREQRRALFSLKQIFQDDKDLVHEFVQNSGLECMIKLGRQADQNHQNYILRALGQIMLYVDGMNGIIAHLDTIQWLYELLDSPYRLVVKTALKLLLVFIEYTDHNALLLMAAVTNVDKASRRPDWYGLMKVLSEKDANNIEMLTYGMTVINKTLNGVADQGTYYDIVDALEAQGLEDAMQQMIKLGNKELSDQCKLYERVLKQEDDAESSDESANMAKMRTLPATLNDRRAIMRRRHQESLARQQEHHNFHKINSIKNKINSNNNNITIEKIDVSKTNGVTQLLEPVKVVPPWRKKSVDEPNTNLEPNNNNNINNNDDKNTSTSDRKTFDESVKEAVVATKPMAIKLFEAESENNENVEPKEKPVRAPPPSFPTTLFSPTENKKMDFPEEVKKEPEPEQKHQPPSKPKVTDDEDEDLPAGSNIFAAQLRRRAAKREQNAAMFEPKQNEAEMQWKKAAESFKSKPLIINDLDFSEFHHAEYEQDPLVMAKLAMIAQEKGLLPAGSSTNGVPPAPPQLNGVPPAPPPLLHGRNGGPPPPPLLSAAMPTINSQDASPIPKTGTLRLHWKPAHAEPPPVPSLKNKGTFWHKLDMPQIDTNKLAQLFEQKAKDSSALKRVSGERSQILQVLPLKRSQAINIGLTKLPPINVIPAAIMKFDSLVLNKEGIEKILTTMMPSPSEIELIEVKAAENPELPLGQAEQFLLKLSQIPCLLERLRLWMFTLDYKNCEKDIAEPLMDLQLAMKEVEDSKTFRTAMAMLLVIGNTLNGTNIKGFQLDYLTKASEVKDPVYKHTLTHHLAEYMIEHCFDGTDLYSEFGAVARTARFDYDDLDSNLKKLEHDCKASWEYLAKISKNDSSSSMKQRINDYLNDVAQRIHQLKAIYRIAFNRWHSFLLFFGYSVQEVPNLKPMNVFKMVIEFALEYRTTRDRILQQRKRLADKRERNKTRGKIWAFEGQMAGHDPESTRTAPSTLKCGSNQAISTQIDAQQRHEAMSRMLVNGDDTLKRVRAKPTNEKAPITMNSYQKEMLRTGAIHCNDPGNSGYESPDDELLNGLVKAATIQSEPRDHKRRARQFNRKSLRRTRTLKLVDDQPGSTLTSA